MHEVDHLTKVELTQGSLWHVLLTVLQLRLRGPTATVAAAAADAAGTSTANAGTDAAPADTNISSASGSGGGSSGSAAAGSALTVASGDTAVVALRQAIAAGLLLLSAQVRQLVEAFTVSLSSVASWLVGIYVQLFSQLYSAA
jgi:hypothetical protein